MTIQRRPVLALITAGLPLIAAGRAFAAHPPSAPALTAEMTAARSLGSPDAKATVVECFSLTCTHCADFSRDVMPAVKARLIDKGAVRWVFADFPLDRVALAAEMVARALPPSRYADFIAAMFSSQSRWAYAPGVDHRRAIAGMAMLAGISRDDAEAALGNSALRDWVLGERQHMAFRYGVKATPTFIINGVPHVGEMSFDAIAAAVGA